MKSMRKPINIAKKNTDELPVIESKALTEEVYAGEYKDLAASLARQYGAPSTQRPAAKNDVAPTISTIVKNDQSSTKVMQKTFAQHEIKVNDFNTSRVRLIHAIKDAYVMYCRAKATFEQQAMFSITALLEREFYFRQLKNLIKGKDKEYVLMSGFVKSEADVIDKIFSRECPEVREECLSQRISAESHDKELKIYLAAKHKTIAHPGCKKLLSARQRALETLARKSSGEPGLNRYLHAENAAIAGELIHILETDTISRFFSNICSKFCALFSSNKKNQPIKKLTPTVNSPLIPKQS